MYDPESWPNPSLLISSSSIQTPTHQITHLRSLAQLLLTFLLNTPLSINNLVYTTWYSIYLNLSFEFITKYPVSGYDHSNLRTHVSWIGRRRIRWLDEPTQCQVQYRSFYLKKNLLYGEFFFHLLLKRLRAASPSKCAKKVWGDIIPFHGKKYLGRPEGFLNLWQKQMK